MGVLAFQMPSNLGTQAQAEQKLVWPSPKSSIPPRLCVSSLTPRHCRSSSLHHTTTTPCHASVPSTHQAHKLRSMHLDALRQQYPAKGKCPLASAMLGVQCLPPLVQMPLLWLQGHPRKVAKRRNGCHKYVMNMSMYVLRQIVFKPESKNVVAEIFCGNTPCLVCCTLVYFGPEESCFVPKRDAKAPKQSPHHYLTVRDASSET